MLQDLKTLYQPNPPPVFRSPLEKWETSRLRQVLEELQQEFSRESSKLFREEHQQAFDVGLSQVLDVPVTGLDTLIETMQQLSDLRRLRNVLSWSNNLKEQIKTELNRREKV